MGSDLDPSEFPQVSVKRWTGASKKWVTRIPLVSSHKFGVHANSVWNVWLGAVKRVFYVENNGVLLRPAKPITGAFERLAAFRGRLLENGVRLSRATYAEFVSRCPSHKRAVYQRACDSLATKALTRRDSFIKGFGKCEKVRIDGDRKPVQRIIHPRDPRYNAALGRYIQTCEKVVFKQIDRVFDVAFLGTPTVFKGMNAVEAGTALASKWGRFLNPVCVGLDASRFDQHVSVEALQWEHSVYPMFFPVGERAELRELLSWQLRNHVRIIASDGMLSYIVDGCRMSGDMNTGLGNTLLMCAMVWEYCRFADVCKFELANNGDDCVVFIEREDLDKFVGSLDTWFLDMGFKMKVEPPVYHLEAVSFCQTSPVQVDHQWRMVRTPARCIGKDCCTILPVRNAKERAAWFKSIGQGGLACASGVPVLQAFYSMFDRGAGSTKYLHTAHLRDSAISTLGRGLASHPVEIADSSRVSFWRAFGITPSCQVHLEDYFNGVSLDSREDPEHNEFVPTEFFSAQLLQ